MPKREAAIAKMSKYLLSGAEMLQDSCPDCKVPLIREKNSKNPPFCAGCGKKVVYASESEVKQIEQEFTSRNHISQVFNNLEAILLGKLEYLGNQAAAANQKELEEIVRLMNSILDLIERLKKQTKIN
ncbi:MAG: Sjogren's syndrome/scleroderma autoantigen 1 family protein [Candidatus Hodarchaeales archaeon]|jgi:uncharacterized Zn finger protein (UPF0148 family)